MWKVIFVAPMFLIGINIDKLRSNTIVYHLPFTFFSGHASGVMSHASKKIMFDGQEEPLPTLINRGGALVINGGGWVLTCCQRNKGKAKPLFIFQGFAFNHGSTGASPEVTCGKSFQWYKLSVKFHSVGRKEQTLGLMVSRTPSY
jgi:hypothetical protein